jgi:hypothetical protein
MPRDFKMTIFYPDGGEPETVAFRPSSLSPKWSKICHDMLDQLGLVFRQNMGHTLSHFDIRLAGPTGRLFVHGYPCYEFSVFRGQRDEPNLATIRHFEDFSVAACKAAHTKFSEAGRAALQGLGDEPALLMFDYCHPEIESDQKLAIGQLGVHLADAYFDYCDDGQPNATPASGPSPPPLNPSTGSGPESVRS